MYIVTNTHVVPVAKLEAEIGEHIASLERHREQGIVLAYGVNAENDGGLILVSDVNERKTVSMLEEDPFQQLELVKYEYLKVKVLAGVHGLKEGSSPA